MTESIATDTSPAEPPSIAALITAEQSRFKLTDDELARAIGYENDNVIAQIKKGTMRLPVNKVIMLARALGVDPVLVLRATLHEQSPELLKILQEIVQPLQFTREERRMIAHLREVCGDKDVKPLVFDGHCVVALVASELRK